MQCRLIQQPGEKERRFETRETAEDWRGEEGVSQNEDLEQGMMEEWKRELFVESRS